MIYSIKRFANVTKSMNKLVNKAKKEIIEAANTKNKKIARRNGKNGADNIKNITKDNKNSFVKSSKEGYTSISYKQNKTPVKKISGPELPFEGGIDKINREDLKKNTSQNLKVNAKDRIREKIQKPKKNEIIKKTRTDGSTYETNNGLVLPKFGMKE